MNEKPETLLMLSLSFNSFDFYYFYNFTEPDGIVIEGKGVIVDSTCNTLFTRMSID